MHKFEYASVAFDTTTYFSGPELDYDAFNQKLNEYGMDGWELVNVFDLNRGQGSTCEVVAVFKRQLS